MGVIHSTVHRGGGSVTEEHYALTNLRAELLAERFAPAARAVSPRPRPANLGGPDTLDAIVHRRRILNAALSDTVPDYDQTSSEAA
jgi:hypothetical protein